ncbi:uncharacterized protein TRIVIDRAFT_60345 [Trichoderma virens Gv29-8]|uniref:Uncharacterized protein n=1 Tax=Hypocrea virens (strain Gv29-8 / FGSC 10586) TaxID=413071 RepID=G9MRV3_HYPVG|nr:uncharacterized protein TRIVIDRAFT_60345 [Trichoderma virens Gv29-8]EHK22822.1 hypothetical protein TRIVIDRAFT_60345 [Trichoderma virens Gv29-8]UKZ47876.1 hypothetical protein TrVGV298_002109 [Trichoderma virens]
MGSGHSKEKKESKKESKRSSRHASSRHSTSRPSKSDSKSKSESKSKSKSSSSKSKSKSSHGPSTKELCADLSPETLEALQVDFLSKLSEPSYRAESHVVWELLTKHQRKMSKQMQANFNHMTEPQMTKFIDEWRRKVPQEMDYGYNVEEDTLYPQEGQSPENALGIYNNEPDSAQDKGKGKEPVRRQNEPDNAEDKGKGKEPMRRHSDVDLAQL